MKRWLKVPLKIAKNADITKEEDLGIPADYTDGWILVAIDEISHIVGDEGPEATIYLKSEEVLLIELSISDISLLLEEKDNVTG